MERRKSYIQRREERSYQRSLARDEKILKKAEDRMRLREFLKYDFDITVPLTTFLFTTGAYAGTRQIFYAVIALPLTYGVSKMMGDFRDE